VERRRERTPQRRAEDTPSLEGLLDVVATRISDLGRGREELLFPSRKLAGGEPLSWRTFNTRYWKPAASRAGIDFSVRVHDLGHAHASWPPAGGAYLRPSWSGTGPARIIDA
jgi:integrase